MKHALSLSLSVDYVGQVAQGQWHEGAALKRVKYIFGSWCEMLYAKLISKRRKPHEQTRFIVCERPLQEHTHTSCTTSPPPGNGKRRTKYTVVYVCVVCVGGVRRSEETFIFPASSPYDPHTQKVSPKISNFIIYGHIYIMSKEA